MPIGNNHHLPESLLACVMPLW